MSATTHSGAEIVRRFYELLGQGEAEAAQQLLHEDLVIDEPPELPFGGIFRGRSAPLDIFARIGPVAQPTVVGDLAIHESDGPVVVTLTGRYTKPSGETIDAPIAELCTVQDGVITRMDVFYKNPGEVAAFFAAG
jgi:ketosteroid isomerase-like protein